MSLTISRTILEVRTTRVRPRALKEATMIVLGITFVALTVIGVAKTVQTVATDGFGRVPTRQF